MKKKKADNRASTTFSKETVDRFYKRVKRGDYQPRYKYYPKGKEPPMSPGLGKGDVSEGVRATMEKIARNAKRSVPSAIKGAAEIGSEFDRGAIDNTISRDLGAEHQDIYRSALEEYEKKKDEADKDLY